MESNGTGSGEKNGGTDGPDKSSGDDAIALSDPYEDGPLPIDLIMRLGIIPEAAEPASTAEDPGSGASTAQTTKGTSPSKKRSFVKLSKTAGARAAGDIPEAGRRAEVAMKQELPGGAKAVPLRPRFRCRALQAVRPHPKEPPPRSGPGGAGAPALDAASQWLSAVRKGGRGAAKRRVEAKQSGASGAARTAGHCGWTARWREGAVNGPRAFRLRGSFPLQGSRAPGKTRGEADAEALRDAVALGEEQAARSERPGSVKILDWNTARKAWWVHIKLDGKTFHGGFFRPKDDTPEEIERARLAAMECRRNLELKHGKDDGHEAARPEQPGSVQTVSWNASRKAWWVRTNLAGKTFHGGFFRPKDDTPEEIERARLAAMECRRKLELKHSRDDPHEAWRCQGHSSSTTLLSLGSPGDPPSPKGLHARGERAGAVHGGAVPLGSGASEG